MSRLIEEWQADIVLSHRPYDYNPDHRYVGVLADDTAFMVSVPFYTPDTPATENNPVYLHYSDFFERPYPFQPDIIVAIDDVFEKKIDAISKLVSQVYEVSWANLGKERLETVRSVPKDPAARRTWLAAKHGARYAAVADQYRDALIRWYGPEKGRAVKYAEAFEICQYGRRPTVEELRQLFPFFSK
jgi:LmbE family N-acetylglucosaminyl deacetylase